MSTFYKITNIYENLSESDQVILKMILKIAKDSYTKFIANNAKKELIDYEDLVMEGLMGYYEVKEKFDNKYNTKMGTFAYYNIKRRIYEYIYSTQYIANVPEHVGKKWQKYKKVLEMVNTFVDFEEVAPFRGYDNIDEWQSGLLYNQIVEYLESWKDREPRDGFDMKEHAFIFMYYYGLIDGQPHTYAEISEFYGVTKQRIGQMVKKVREILKKRFEI